MRLTEKLSEEANRKWPTGNQMWQWRHVTLKGSWPPLRLGRSIAKIAVDAILRSRLCDYSKPLVVCLF